MSFYTRKAGPILFGLLCLGLLLWSRPGWLPTLLPALTTPQEQLTATTPAENVVQLAAVPATEASAATVRTVSNPRLARATAAVTAGQRMSQTFTLRAGWNAIYLELEPDNPSPLVNVGTTAEPYMIHAEPTIPAIFGEIAGLESIWTWNVPLSQADYIVDPTEAELWDKPGWRRYVADPAAASNSSDNVQTVPADLVNLHANQGYLVKLADDATTTTLTLTGVPQVTRQRWLPATYNLAGFPIQPGGAPTVADFFAGSPITEVYALSTAGEWQPLADSDTLQQGTAYFVYHASVTANDAPPFTAPFHVLGLPSDGLRFLPGGSGQRATLQIENLSDSSIDVVASLWPAGQESAVALMLDEQRLSEGPATISLSAGAAQRLTFSVPRQQQTADGAAILELIAEELAVRWLIPVVAESGSLAGLWVGDVTVNDVSESRLGGTNVQNGELTVAMRSRGNSGIGGAVTLIEAVTGNDVAMALSLTLTLPAIEVVRPTVPPTATANVLTGYLFEDSNQNGLRDGSEPGLADRTVMLVGERAALTATTPLTASAALSATQIWTTTTAADGRYHFAALPSGTYAISATTPANYTDDFAIQLPAPPETAGADTEADSVANPVTATVNTLPSQIQMDAGGLAAVVPATYLAHLRPLGVVELPHRNDANHRAAPPINFGFVPVHLATLQRTGPGGCGALLQIEASLGAVKNGRLQQTLAQTSLNPPPGTGARQLLGAGSNYAIVVTDAAGEQVACGEIDVGSPTRLADGRGSEFTFRVILRVAEDGTTELLPYYEAGRGATDANTRISSANFSLIAPTRASGLYADPHFRFSIVVDPNDPRNPFKHKYHPDHDNLDRQFNPIDLDAVDPNFWESYAVRREIQLQPVDDLREIPAFADLEPGAAAKLAAEVDWGGATRGGLYHEVLSGVHKNDITVQGHFVVRHVLTADKLETQSYDQ